MKVKLPIFAELQHDNYMKRLFIAIVAALLVDLIGCTVEQETLEIKVESITIDQEDLTLTEGESVTLTATVLPENAADKTIKWSSSNDEVVMIASNGKAKALIVGSAEITATAGEKTDFITITVASKTIHVTGISLNPTSITMKVGESQTIVPELTPQDATDKSVTWSSSNPDVASVENGTVAGLKPGSVTITATTTDGGKTAECAVTVKTNLEPSVTIGVDHISAVSAVLSGEANLESTMASDMTMGMMWSTNSAVLPSNSTKIVANDISVKQGLEASYSYSVNLPGLNPSSTYYYRSYVSQNGVDTYGTIESFTTKDIASLIATKDAADIKAKRAVLKASLDLTDVIYENLAYGFYYGTDEQSLTMEAKGGEITDLSYSTTIYNLLPYTQYWYRAYLTVDNQKLYGDITTFTTDVVPVESVSLNETDYTFHTIGGSLALLATVSPYDATNNSIVWSSDNEAVATVSQRGLVKAIGNGKASITVSTEDQGKTASCVISVAQWVTSITLSHSLLCLAVGEEMNLSVTDVLPTNAFDKTYTWYSTYNPVATVDLNGKVTARAPGNAVIRAMANDGSGILDSCFVCVNGAVDLGLNIKWSSMNLGATRPEEQGDYFAWGETEPYYSSQNPLVWNNGKTGYNWASYKWCNGSSSTLTKYNTNESCGVVDDRIVLDPEDDAAHVILGGGWRMPTYEECDELQKNCTWTWTAINGINGIIATSNKNGNSIFLPAAGLLWDSSLGQMGSYGHYWSSSLFPEIMDNYARKVEFRSDNRVISVGSRFAGCSIRPVCE